MAPPDRRIIVTFEDFALERDHDFIQFRKPQNMEEPFLILPCKSKNITLNSILILDFVFSATGISYNANPPTFRSDSNSATLRFMTDAFKNSHGIVMAYILGKYFYFYLSFMLLITLLKLNNFIDQYYINTIVLHDETIYDSQYNFILKDVDKFYKYLQLFQMRNCASTIVFVQEIQPIQGVTTLLEPVI